MNKLWICRLVQLLFLMVALSSCSEAQTTLKDKEKESNWENLEAYWNKYMITDSIYDTNNLYDYIINHGDFYYTPQEKVGLIQNRMYDSLSILHRRIEIHDSNAVKIAFALMRIADGAFMEDLTTDIGDLITIDPAMFLTYLKKHKYLVPNPKSILLPYLDDFDDEEVKIRKKEEDEISKRISALKSVEITDMIPLRDECISILKRSIKDN